MLRPKKHQPNAIVNGISPPRFTTYVRSLHTDIDDWKRDPNVVMNTIFDAWDNWKSSEAYGGNDSTANTGGARQKQQQQQKQKQYSPALSTRACCK